MGTKTKLKFAVSLSGGISEWVSALKIADVSLFKSVQLPGECLDSRANRSALESPDNDIFKIFKPRKRNFEVVSVTDIAPASSASEISEQSPKIVADFVENIRLSISELKKLKIGSCTLNVAAENVFAHEEKRHKRIKLLKRIAPVLQENKIILSIPVRLPTPAEVDAEQFPAFIRETMSPWIKLAVNIHPHEIKPQMSPAELLRPFRFQMDTASFIYEPEAGNFLVDKLMAPWFELLADWQFSGPVIFVPRTSNIAVFSRETERITAIVKHLL